MRILLPVDTETDARLIASFVCNHHWPQSPTFLLMHVIGNVADETAYLHAQAAADKLLDEVASWLKAAIEDATVTAEIRSGDAAFEIIGAASAWRADMIVMGYRVRTDIQSMIAGSVSKGVTIQAPCSVAIIRPAVSLGDDSQSGANLDQEEEALSLP